MTIEDQLRDSLRRRATAVRPHPDLADVTDRATRHDRRTRRLLGLALVVALVAGPLAGFAIGNGIGGGDDPDVIATGSAGRAADAAGTSALPFAVGAPLERLFVRTTVDGVVVRAYRSSVDGSAVADDSSVCPDGVPECAPCDAPSAFVTGELSTDAAVTIAAGNASSSGDAAFGPSTSWGTFGVAEGAPARWVLVSTGTAVQTVRATFPNGTTDEMEPVDGVALLAAPVADGSTGGVAVDAIGTDGSILQSTVVGEDSSEGAASSSSATARSGAGSASTDLPTTVAPLSSSSGTLLSCASPPTDATPPTLPPPGEQPADPASARKQVEDAFVHTYDGSKSMVSREGDVENGDASKIQGDIEAGPYADEVTRSSATVSDVVFTSPTEASVIYGITVQGGNNFPERRGKAVLVGETWKVSGETLCRDLNELLGLQCPKP